jgi:hypothetical protein
MAKANGNCDVGYKVEIIALIELSTAIQRMIPREAELATYGFEICIGSLRERRKNSLSSSDDRILQPAQMLPAITSMCGRSTRGYGSTRVIHCGAPSRRSEWIADRSSPVG